MQSTRYSCQIIMKLEFSRQIFVKYSNIKLHENPIRSVVFCDFTQREVVIPYRRFRTTYRSHLQGSRNQKMGPIGCPETTVRNYYFALRKITEERRSHLHRGGSLKSS